MESQSQESIGNDHQVGNMTVIGLKSIISNMKNIYLFIFLLLPLVFYGQNKSKIDSIKRLLPTQRDTIKLKSYGALNRLLISSDTDLSKNYLDSLVIMAKELDIKKFNSLALSRLGYYYYYISDYNKAEYYNNEAIKLHRELNLKAPLYKALNVLGVSQKYLGKLEESMESHMESLALKEELGVSGFGLGASYVNIGNLLAELDNFEASNEYYLKASSVLEEAGLISYQAQILHNIGVNQDELKNQEAPGQFIKHYSPNIETYIFDFYSENENLEEKVERRTNQINHTLKELEKVNLKLYDLAHTDHLTQIKNRRSFFMHAKVLYDKAKKEKDAMAVIMIDIDNFKRYNDTYGHEVGDKILKNFSNIIKSSISDNYIFGRLGGEEFVIFVCSEDKIEKLADRLVKGVSSESFYLDNGVNIQVTVSVGVAPINNFYAQYESAYQKADSSLYEAKKQGKNQFAVSLSHCVSPQ